MKAWRPGGPLQGHHWVFKSVGADFYINFKNLKVKGTFVQNLGVEIRFPYNQQVQNQSFSESVGAAAPKLTMALLSLGKLNQLKVGRITSLCFLFDTGGKMSIEDLKFL